MRALHLLLYLVLGFATSFAQKAEFQLAYRYITPAETRTFNFIYSAHVQGTDGLDTAIGEREIPSLPPPAGVYFVYTIPPVEEYMWFSPLEIRKLPDVLPVRHDFETNVLWTGGRLEVVLSGVFPPLVDSVYLVDALTDFPDNFIKHKIEPGTVFSTTNSALTRFRILVWYSPLNSSVDERTSEDNSIVYPNPATDVISIQNLHSATVTITDQQGVTVCTITEYSGQPISVKDLPSGVYRITATSAAGTSQKSLIIRR